MARSPQLVRFAARRKALIALLRGLPRPLMAGAKVQLAEVLAAIAKLDTRALIAAFADDLGGSAGDGVTAIKYEWYYDGTDPALEALGYTYRTCKKPASYSKTDLVKLGPTLGVESDVVLDDPIAEVGYLDVGRVLKTQHRLCKKVDEYSLHVEAEQRVPSLTEKQRHALPDLCESYRHLFDLTLYELVHAACAKVRDRAPYVFVGTHERWPILVGTPWK